MDSEWDEYQLKSELEECKTNCDLLMNMVKKLEIENKDLKDQISKLAIENSNLSDAMKRKKNVIVEQKWKYYHDNKDNIKKQLQKDNEKVTWGMIKKESDSRFTQENSLTKNK